MAAVRASLSAKKRELFLEALAECGNVAHSAKQAGFTFQRAYQIRAEDKDFASLWDSALEQAADKLEREAWRRAHDGVEEPVTSVKGIVRNDDGTPLMVRKYSDTLLIFLLKGVRPEKFRDRVQTEHSGGQTLTVRYENDWRKGAPVQEQTEATDA